MASKKKISKKKSFKASRARKFLSKVEKNFFKLFGETNRELLEEIIRVRVSKNNNDLVSVLNEVKNDLKACVFGILQEEFEHGWYAESDNLDRAVILLACAAEACTILVELSEQLRKYSKKAECSIIKLSGRL